MGGERRKGPKPGGEDRKLELSVERMSRTAHITFSFYIANYLRVGVNCSHCFFWLFLCCYIRGIDFLLGFFLLVCIFVCILPFVYISYRRVLLCCFWRFISIYLHFLPLKHGYYGRVVYAAVEVARLYILREPEGADGFPVRRVLIALPAADSWELSSLPGSPVHEAASTDIDSLVL